MTTARPGSATVTRSKMAKRPSSWTEHAQIISDAS
jgi:hypothetical protein